MHTPSRSTVCLIVAAAIGFAIQPLLGSRPEAATPYESALTALPSSVVPASPRDACENKKCDANQGGGKCADNPGTSCDTITFHGRGHGSSCTNNICPT